MSLLRFQTQGAVRLIWSGKPSKPRLCQLWSVLAYQSQILSNRHIHSKCQTMILINNEINHNIWVNYQSQTLNLLATDQLKDLAFSMTRKTWIRENPLQTLLQLVCQIWSNWARFAGEEICDIIFFCQLILSTANTITITTTVPQCE